MADLALELLDGLAVVGLAGDGLAVEGLIPCGLAVALTVFLTAGLSWSVLRSEDSTRCVEGAAWQQAPHSPLQRALRRSVDPARTACRPAAD